MPKVSVIITCYNLGAYLEEAIESVRAQNYTDFELLVIDDGSTDAATIAVLDRLGSDAELRLIRTPNQGVARARNQCIEASTGLYILPLDADDRILPEYLARAVAVLEQCPEVGFVGCHYCTFGDREIEYTPASYQLPELLVENVVPISSLFRRECWSKAGGYCADLNGMEDWDLWLSILGQGYAGAVVPKILFEYRVRQQSNIAQIREPQIYQARQQLLYQRHQKLYDRYIYDVLSWKDHLFARQLAHNAWLEQQWHIWEDIAQQRLVAIDTHDRSIGMGLRVRMWWQRQSGRYQRIKAEHPPGLPRLQALMQGTWRVAVRRAQQVIQGQRRMQ